MTQANFHMYALLILQKGQNETACHIVLKMLTLSEDYHGFKETFSLRNTKTPLIMKVSSK